MKKKFFSLLKNLPGHLIVQFKDKNLNSELLNETSFWENITALEITHGEDNRYNTRYPHLVMVLTANGISRGQGGCINCTHISLGFIETKSNEIYGIFDGSVGGASYSFRAADSSEFADIKDIPKVYKDAHVFVKDVLAKEKVTIKI